MVVYLIANFAIAPAYTPAAAVYADSEDDAIAMLRKELDKAKFAYRSSGRWIVLPLTPLPLHPRVVVINDTFKPPRSATELRGTNRRSTN